MNIVVSIIFVFDNAVYPFSQSIEALRVPSSIKDRRIAGRMAQCVNYLASNHSTRRDFLKTSGIAAALALGNVMIPTAANSQLTAPVLMSSEQSNELLALVQLLRLFRDSDGSPMLTDEKIMEIIRVYGDEITREVSDSIDLGLFVESSLCERMTRRSDSDKFLKILISSIVAYLDQDILSLIKRQPYDKQVEYGAWLYSSCLSTTFFSYALFSARDVPGVHVTRTSSHMFTILSQENVDIDASPISFVDIAMRNFLRIDSLKDFYEKAGKYYVLKKSKRIDPFNHRLGLALLRFKQRFIINNSLPVSQQGEMSYRNTDSFFSSEGVRMDENSSPVFQQEELSYKSLDSFLKSEGLSREEIRLLLLNGLYPCLQINGQSDLISGLLQTIGNIHGDISTMDKKRQKEARAEELKAYERAVGFNPENSELFYNIGETFWLRFKAHGDYRDRQNAVRYMAKAIELDPSNASAYYEIGRIYRGSYLEQQRIKRGFNSPEEFKKAIEQSDIKTVEMFDSLMEDAFLRSKTALEKAIEYDPCYWRPYIGLGDIYAEMNRPDQAITLYAKAIVVNGQAKNVVDKKFRKEAEKMAAKLKKTMEENRRIKESINSYGAAAAIVGHSL